MNKMLTTTALIAMLATPALAQTATDPAATAPAADATTTMPATDGTATMPADGTAAPATMGTVTPTDGTAATTMTTTAGATEMGFGYVATPTDVSAETFIGKNLYVSDVDVDVNATYTDIDAGWNDIGSINDLVIDSQTGEVQAVLVDIGGFLGLGARTVSVSMDQLRLISDGDSQGDYFIVFTSTREQLENAPEFEWGNQG